MENGTLATYSSSELLIVFVVDNTTYTKKFAFSAFIYHHIIHHRSYLFFDCYVVLCYCCLHHQWLLDEKIHFRDCYDYFLVWILYGWHISTGFRMQFNYYGGNFFLLGCTDRNHQKISLWLEWRQINDCLSVRLLMQANRWFFHRKKPKPCCLIS